MAIGTVLMAGARALMGVGSVAGGLVRTVWGDRAQREANAHDAFMASARQYGDEFNYRQNRTWFDSLVDGLNRMPRPIFAFGTIALFAFAMYNPVQFAVRMQGLVLVPEPLWLILGAIIAFYFGARELAYHRDMKVSGAKREEVAEVVGNIRELRTLDPALAPGLAAISEQEFQAEMRDTSKPMSNAAIAEWNRRNGG